MGRAKTYTEEEAQGRVLANARRYKASAKGRAVALARRRERRASETPEQKELRLSRRRTYYASAPPTKKSKVAEEHKRNYRRRKAAGICIACTELATAGLRCMHHWFECVGRNYGLTIKNGGIEILKALWEEQGSRCALTGAQLVPTVNATLDHILPQSRGGTHAKSNLQWVTRRSNEAKNDLTTHEFLELCRSVLLRHETPSNVVQMKKVGAS